MSDTTKRYLYLLQNIPIHPAKISAPELQRKLASISVELEVDIRYIQRDLINLSSGFAIFSSKDDPNPEKARQKPYGWSWEEGSDRFSFPGIDVETALTMIMAGEHLKHLLPASSSRLLKVHFKDAEKKLGDMQSSSIGRLRSWRKKVAAIPTTLSLQPPQISNSVTTAVHDALLRDQCLKFTYKKSPNHEKKIHTVNPIGLVYRGPVPYLIATINDHENLLQFSLARMQHAERLDEHAKLLKSFSLSEYVSSGAFGILVDEKKPTLKLKLKIQEGPANTLRQTPLSTDQNISNPRKGFVTVKATVTNIMALRSFILSYGSTAEVLEPKSLRQELATDLKKAAALYR